MLALEGGWVVSGRGQREVSGGANEILDLGMSRICVCSFCEN